MGWTICQPHPPNKQARKVYAENKDATDWTFNLANRNTDQNLQDEEILSLDLLFEFLTHSFLDLLIEHRKCVSNGLSVWVGVGSKKSRWVKKTHPLHGKHVLVYLKKSDNLLK